MAGTFTPNIEDVQRTTTDVKRTTTDVKRTITDVQKKITAYVQQTVYFVHTRIVVKQRNEAPICLCLFGLLC